MASLDEIFYKEFTKMMNMRKSTNALYSLSEIPLPSEGTDSFYIETHNKVIISGVTDEYYSKLNGTEPMLWGKGQLRRRKFDYKGEFIMKDNNYVLEDVALPHNCVAIISDVNLNVPLKYKPDDNFSYVDYGSKVLESGKKLVKYFYIVPRKYCYKLNQTALVLSWNKLRSYYWGIKLALTCGRELYVQVIPYKPTQSTKPPYRILCCKTSSSYDEELTLLQDFWLKNNVIFNPALCECYAKGRENMAYQILDGVLDVYERFDSEHSMDNEEEDFDYKEN